MTSRERVLTAFARGKPDRVPVNYDANPDIDGRLKAHFGLDAKDNRGLRDALGVDFAGVWAPYRGPKLHADIPERNVTVDNWGIHRTYVRHTSGGYWDYCDFPLKDATEEQIAAWPMPDPDQFDYAAILDQCRQAGTRAIGLGDPGVSDLINSTGMLRTMEQVLVDFITDDPAGLLLAKRKSEINLQYAQRVLETVKRGGARIDFFWMGEDLGTQRGPVISLQLYRKHIRPIQQRFVDLAKAYELPVMIHSCGSSSWVYDDFVAMGVNVVDTLQPEAHNMSPAYLKKTFGDRLAFHGCISTAGPVARGTVDETIADCRQTLEIMMPGGGYCFAPTHALQDNSPTENVLAMYETARKFGTY